MLMSRMEIKYGGDFGLRVGFWANAGSGPSEKGISNVPLFWQRLG
jgi:hypothetical protein